MRSGLVIDLALLVDFGQGEEAGRGGVNPAACPRMGCFLDTNVLLYAVSTTPAEASKRQLARYCPVSIRMTGGADGDLGALHRAAH